MSPVLVGVLGLVMVFVFLFMGVPIGFTLAFIGFLGFIVLGSLEGAVSMMATVPYTTVAAYIFSVVPLFLLMGEYMSVSGLLHDAYRGIHTWLGRMPGGLAMATIGACAGFAACTGTSVAAIATMTRISLPEMLEYKYDRGLATGTIAAGGTLGILIPPSIPLVVYGIITETSIGGLFMAGIVPGILLAFMFMITIYIVAKRNPKAAPRGPGTTWWQRLVAIKDVWGIALVFLIVMGGIWGGIFTPTEAGSIGALGAFIFAIARKKVTRQNLFPTFLAALRTSGLGFVLVIGAFIFSYFIAVSRLPSELAAFVGGLPIPPLAIMGAIMVLYMIMGCLMDPISLMLLTVPILLPLIQALGFDLIWYGIMVTVMTELGLITPPIGMNVFIMAGMRRDIPMYTIFRGIFPFVVTFLAITIILLFFPQIILWLPNTMMG